MVSLKLGLGPAASVHPGVITSKRGNRRSGMRLTTDTQSKFKPWVGACLIALIQTLVEFSAIEQTYDIIVDCTAFSTSSELPLPWIKYLIDMIPSDLAVQFRLAYIVNSNGAAQVYLRKVLHALASK